MCIPLYHLVIYWPWLLVFFAGVSAGIAWGWIAGYARRMVSDEFKGRGMAIAMIGTPIALTFDVAIGMFLGALYPFCGYDLDDSSQYTLYVYCPLSYFTWYATRRYEYMGYSINKKRWLVVCIIFPSKPNMLDTVKKDYSVTSHP